jgi:PhnB protein
MTTQSGTNADEISLREVVHKRADAIRAKKTDDVLLHFAPTSVVIFSLAPPLRNRTTSAQELEAWFATFRGVIDYEVCELHTYAASDLAFCHSLNRLSGTSTDGAKVDLWFRETLCFRKVSGRWLIVHAHESVPFYMDGSFRAATNLSP